MKSLLFGTFVSILIFLAVLRTHILVQKALSQLKNNGSTYYKLQNKISLPPDANIILLIVPIILTILFIGLTVNAFIIWINT